MTDTNKPSLSYKDAGVDIEAGNILVNRIKPFVKATDRAGVMGGFGGFGSFFCVPIRCYRYQGVLNTFLASLVLYLAGVKKMDRPEKTFFELALKDMNLSPKESIMIGDDIINDVEGAQLAGVKGVLVKTGKYRKDLVEKSNIEPDLIISSIDEIIKYI